MKTLKEFEYKDLKNLTRVNKGHRKPNGELYIPEEVLTEVANMEITAYRLGNKVWVSDNLNGGEVGIPISFFKNPDGTKQLSNQ